MRAKVADSTKVSAFQESLLGPRGGRVRASLSLLGAEGDGPLPFSEDLAVASWLAGSVAPDLVEALSSWLGGRFAG